MMDELKKQENELLQYKNELNRAKQRISDLEQLLYNKADALVNLNYRYLLESLPNVVLIAQNGIFVYANRSAEKILGYSRNELIGMKAIKIFEPSFREKAKVQIENAQNGATNPKTEYKSICKNGDIIWTETISVPILFNNNPASLLIKSNINDMVLAREELKKRESILSKILEILPVGLWLADEKGNLVSANSKGLEIWGKPAFVGQKEYGIFKARRLPSGEEIKPDDWALGYSINKGITVRDELLEIDAFDGVKRTILNYTAPVFNDDGKIECAIVVNQDVSELKATENSLRASQELYKLIAEKTTDVIWLMDLNKKSLYVSPSIERFTGFTVEEYINQSIEQRFTKESADYAKHIFSEELQLFKKDKIDLDNYLKSIELEYLCKNGISKWGELIITPYLDKNNKLRGIHGVTRDITERKNTERVLKESEERFHTDIEESPIAIFIANRQGKYTFVNPAACKLVGYNKEELLKMYISDLRNKNKTGKPFFETLKYLGKITNISTQLLDKNGEIIDIILNAVKLNDDQFIAYCADVSELKKAHHEIDKKNDEIALKNLELQKHLRDLQIINKELANAKEKAEESDKLKSTFLANMSHEIRTPMNGILGFAELLSNDNLENEKRKRFTQILKDSCLRLLNVVNDVLDISKIETGQMVIAHNCFNVNIFLNDIIQFHTIKANEKKLELKLELPKNPISQSIITDQLKLRQIINNLINNSLKFTDKGRITLGYTYSDDSINFQVKDTGIGIDKNDFGMIFNRFNQANSNISDTYGGTGLGLPICKSLAELLGGEIRLESSLGKGSVFNVSIPLEIGTCKGIEATVEDYIIPDLKLLDRSIILLAEDEAHNRLYFENIFADSGITLILAENGKTAVDIVKSNHKIDVVIMDIKMPVMDGFEALSKIKKIKQELPVIALTAYAMANEKEKILKAGFDDYLAKPVNINDMIKTLVKTVGKKNV